MYYKLIIIANLSDNLSSSDLTVKGKFSFFKNWFNMAAERSYITKKEGLTTSSNYKLEFRPDAKYSTITNHNENGDMTCEGEYTLWQSKDDIHRFGIYRKSEMDSEMNLNSSMQFLYNHKKYFFNFGFYKNPFKNEKASCVDPSFSFGGLGRTYEKDGLSLVNGIHIDFNRRIVTNAKFILGFVKGDINGLVQYQISKKIGSDTEEKTEMITVKELKVGLESKICDKFTLFNLSGFEINENSTDFNYGVGGQYSFDPLTFLKFSLKSDKKSVGTVAFTRRFREFIDFTFLTRMRYVPGDEKAKKLGRVKTKFGLEISFVEE
jgi:hypothetical protein